MGVAILLGGQLSKGGVVSSYGDAKWLVGGVLLIGGIYAYYQVLVYSRLWGSIFIVLCFFLFFSQNINRYMG